MVCVAPETNFRKIKRHVPAILLELEALGIDRVSYFGLGAIRAELRRYGIGDCASSDATEKHPPGFYLWPDVSAAWVGDGNGIRRFCEEFLSSSDQADVLGKLKRSALRERHVALIVTIDRIGPHTAIDLGEVPAISPQPPGTSRWPLGDRIEVNASSHGVLDTHRRMEPRAA